MTLPADADQVAKALRLGWYVAEVRGRNRPDPPKLEATTRPSRMGDALPLRVA